MLPSGSRNRPRAGATDPALPPTAQHRLLAGRAPYYAELAERIGARPPATAGRSIYAVSCRARRCGRRHQVQAWEHALEVGAPLPTLPLWISESQYVPLELERTYEETCKGLRIP
jgi:hypothetical protein